jgi:hypothetical protein
MRVHNSSRRLNLEQWWREAWHESHALAVLLGVHALFVGLAVVREQGQLVFSSWFGAIQLVYVPLFIGSMAIYAGLILMFHPSTRWRYLMLGASLALSTYLAVSYLLAALAPDITIAVQLANMCGAVVALVRARAWWKR